MVFLKEKKKNNNNNNGVFGCVICTRNLGKAIILNSIRRKFWVWLKQKKEIQNLPEFVGGICEAKILATNSTSKGVIFRHFPISRFTRYLSSISFYPQIRFSSSLSNRPTLHQVGSPTILLLTVTAIGVAFSFLLLF